MENESFKQISSLVSGRLPEFVRVDHPTLVAFLEAYYEWLQLKDREGKVLSPMALQDVIDIDGSMDDFISHFKKEYLLDFPEQLAIARETGNPVDVRKLMKNIKSFYRAKGTEKSYEFLFRILYDTAVEFYYPKKDILRVSDGKWYEKVSIKVSNSLGDRIFESVGRVVYQRNSEGKITSSGKVTDVTIYQQGPYEVAELILTGRNGTFTPGSRGIQFDVDGETLRELRVYSVVGSVTISDGGSGYAVGDKVVFTSAASDSGEGAVGTVSLVTSAGAIRKIRIDNFGINYQAAPTVSVESIGGSGFSGTSNISSVCVAEGYYINSDGLLSSRKVMQDNHYYQDYSYVLKTEVVVDEYRDALRRLVHPAGLAMFGQVLIKRCAKEDIQNSSALIRYEVPLIGHYAPYTFNTFDNLQDWFSIPGTGASAGINISSGYNPTFHNSLITAGAFAAIPVEQTTKGNPITNQIRFQAPSLTAYAPLGLSGFKNADPFWIVYEHPNRKIEGPVIAQIWRSQLSDFATWGEHCSVTGGAIGGWTSDFYEDLSLEKKYAFLNYNDTSSFRKITARSFFEMPIGEEFDCRTESREYYARPIISITNPLNGQSIKIGATQLPSLTVRFSVFNFGTENLNRVGATRFRVTLDSGNERLLNLGERSALYATVSAGIHTIKVELVDSSDQPVGISDSVVFSYSVTEGVGVTANDTSAERPPNVVDPLDETQEGDGGGNGGGNGGGGDDGDLSSSGEIDTSSGNQVDPTTTTSGGGSGGGTQPQTFRILYDGLPKTGDPQIDAAYQAEFDLVSERLYLIGESATGVVGGVEVPVVSYQPYDGVTPASVSVNTDALASHMFSLGIEPNSPTKKYVSFNLNESVWDYRMLGQDLPESGFTGDVSAQGPSNVLATNQIKTFINKLKPIFGSNVKMTTVGYPYIPFYAGYQGGLPYDPNGGWWTTTVEQKESRTAWAATQFESVFEAHDFANEHVYDYSPRRKDVVDGLAAPSNNIIYTNPTLGVQYNYDTSGEQIDEYMLAGCDAVERIRTKLNKGASFDHIPIYSRVYIGENVFHYTNTGNLIPKEDVIEFLVKMKTKYPNLAGISFWGQSDYAVNLLPCWETVAIPGDPNYVVPTRIPEWASWFTGTLEDWQRYNAQNVTRARQYQDALRDSYVRILFGGVAPFGDGQLFSGWTDPKFKTEITKRYNDYTLELYRTIRSLPGMSV